MSTPEDRKEMCKLLKSINPDDKFLNEVGFTKKMEEIGVTVGKNDKGLSPADSDEYNKSNETGKSEYDKKRIQFIKDSNWCDKNVVGRALSDAPGNVSAALKSSGAVLSSGELLTTQGWKALSQNTVRSASGLAKKSAYGLGYGTLILPGILLLKRGWNNVKNPPKLTEIKRNNAGYNTLISIIYGDLTKLKKDNKDENKTANLDYLISLKQYTDARFKEFEGISHDKLEDINMKNEEIHSMLEKLQYYKKELEKKGPKINASTSDNILSIMDSDTKLPLGTSLFDESSKTTIKLAGDNVVEIIYQLGNPATAADDAIISLAVKSNTTQSLNDAILKNGWRLESHRLSLGNFDISGNKATPVVGSANVYLKHLKPNMVISGVKNTSRNPITTSITGVDFDAAADKPTLTLSDVCDSSGVDLFADVPSSPFFEGYNFENDATNASTKFETSKKSQLVIGMNIIGEGIADGAVIISDGTNTTQQVTLSEKIHGKNGQVPLSAHIKFNEFSGTGFYKLKNKDGAQVSVEAFLESHPDSKKEIKDKIIVQFGESGRYRIDTPLSIQNKEYKNLSVVMDVQGAHKYNTSTATAIFNQADALIKIGYDINAEYKPKMKQLIKSKTELKVMQDTSVDITKPVYIKKTAEIQKSTEELDKISKKFKDWDLSMDMNGYIERLKRQPLYAFELARKLEVDAKDFNDKIKQLDTSLTDTEVTAIQKNIIESTDNESKTTLKDFKEKFDSIVSNLGELYYKRQKSANAKAFWNTPNKPDLTPISVITTAAGRNPKNLTNVQYADFYAKQVTEFDNQINEVLNKKKTEDAAFKKLEEDGRINKSVFNSTSDEYKKK